MKTYMNLFQHLMYRSGLRSTIPAEVINSIKIIENDEPLFDIKQDERLFFGDKLTQKTQVFLRCGAYERLKFAIEKLPRNYYFKIYSAFRSLQQQTDLWNNKYAQNKQENPSLSDNELVKLTRVFCADPRNGFGGHQTGGAVDISLCDRNGVDYDMGTKYSQTGDAVYTKAKGISPESVKNRKILLNALQKSGFVNYPGEWWHFCYGDRMWAAYKGRKACFYGAVNEETGRFS